MKLLYTKILKENKPSVLENVKQAKQYVDLGRLTQQDLVALMEADPTPTRKYVGWMASQWARKSVTSIDTLRNVVEEYHTFLQRGKAKTKDIYQFKTFQELQKEVDALNRSGEAVSSKELESDYETLVDTQDLLIMTPHTHEASRKLGLSHFAFRDCEGGGKDSAWCTTYKAPDHFNDYYYNNDVTFYYVRIRSKSLLENLKTTFPERWKQLLVVALAVLPDGQVDGYDGLDDRMPRDVIQAYTDLIGIS